MALGETDRQELLGSFGRWQGMHSLQVQSQPLWRGNIISNVNHVWELLTKVHPRAMRLHYGGNHLRHDTSSPFDVLRTLLPYYSVVHRTNCSRLMVWSGQALCDAVAGCPFAPRPAAKVSRISSFHSIRWPVQIQDSNEKDLQSSSLSLGLSCAYCVRSGRRSMAFVIFSSLNV